MTVSVLTIRSLSAVAVEVPMKFVLGTSAAACRLAKTFRDRRPWLRRSPRAACVYVMPDLERIGGVTGWQRAAGLASAAGIEMSSHLFPEVSAHLLAVTPTAHWLEYVDWANAILREPLRLVDGRALISERPGNGLEWDEQAVRRYRMA